jgi:hypothetical protein
VDLMHKHVGHLTVLDHGDGEGNECNEHAWEHRWITLIEGVLADQIIQDGHRHQELEIKLKHAPPLWPVVIKEIVPIFELEYFLMLWGVDALSEKKRLECVWGDLRVGSNVLVTMRWINLAQFQGLL